MSDNNYNALQKIINAFYIIKTDFTKNNYFDAWKNINFDFWQNIGLHITPNHFYSPIPDTTTLKSKDFEEKPMIGFNFNASVQINLLNKLAIFKDEYANFEVVHPDIDNQKDPKFYFNNLAYDGTDALSYYGLIRLLKPKRVVEIGSGWSTKIAAQACIKNGSTELYSIEPYPQPILVKGFPGLRKLVTEKVEDIKLDFFQTLNSGDILFIDSSHVTKVGGDVNYIFFEILPRLKKGVYIHFHDIFLPFDYPKDWVIKEHRFWSEQYLLHAFLLFNDSYEVIYSNSYLANKYEKNLKRVFPSSPSLNGGSFWIRKTK